MKDTIYREDAIKAIKEYHFFINNQCKYPSEGCIEVIEDAINVPSVDRPQGEWIDRGMRVPSSWVKKCSLCGHETDTWRWCNFCPNCGARMKGADDE